MFRLFRSAVWLVEILIKGKIFKDAAAVAAAVPTTPPAGRMNTKKKSIAKRTKVEWSQRDRGVCGITRIL